MKKTELVALVAKDAGITKVAAEKALNSVIASITKALAKDDKVALVGFGTFSVKASAARAGLNPQTKKPIRIAAKNRPKFSAGKTLKEAVNKKKK
jgi:DNA-binding protein HU-beta